MTRANESVYSVKLGEGPALDICSYNYNNYKVTLVAELYVTTGC